MGHKRPGWQTHAGTSHGGPSDRVPDRSQLTIEVAHLRAAARRTGARADAGSGGASAERWRSSSSSHGLGTSNNAAHTVSVQATTPLTQSRVQQQRWNRAR